MDQPPPGSPAHAGPAAAPARPAAWFGISDRTVEFEPTAASGGQRAGGRLELVLPGSPAEAAGALEDDIVLAINDKPTRSAEEVSAAIAAASPGATMPL